MTDSASFDPALKEAIERAKTRATMHEFKHGMLHSGSKRGPKVISRKQAVAIALAQAKRYANPGGAI